MKSSILKLDEHNECEFFGLYKDSDTCNEPYIILQINQVFDGSSKNIAIVKMKKMQKWLNKTIKFMEKQK